MVSDADFEQGRKELEALLNREISATEDIEKWPEKRGSIRERKLANVYYFLELKHN